MKENVRFETVRMVTTAILAAIIILMAFTPIGYLKTAGLEITFIQIPVTLGAILLGPTAGLILGAVFGISSFIQCFGMSPFGAELLQINPFFTLIVCLVPRMLMGWLTGVIFKGISKLEKSKNQTVSNIVASVASPLMNTIFFMSGIVLFFYNTDYIQSIATALGSDNFFIFILLFVGINGLVEAIACMLITPALAISLKKITAKMKL